MIIIACDQPPVRSGEYDFAILWIRRYPSALTSTHIVPVASCDARVVGSTGYPYSGIILLGAIDMIWEIVVDGDAIKLRSWLVLFGPGFSAVERYIGAAVI